ncbi:ethanolaminephosphotransferase 1-like [Argopecten irradians]|uniref:ethanolaminephosphotransferase 1-like n=1 Tax=Argopecten irradians TaxID=31199 RepID=UPI0037205301
MATYRYLSPEVLSGFDRYKYSSVDTSPISKYITHPFWDKLVQVYPRWLAPNVLTLAGFSLLVVSFVVLTIIDPNFYAASVDQPGVPNWVWLLCSFNVFWSHTLDGTDGKQARRTGSSSPLGELFDHGLDSWATLFFPINMYSIYGRGEFGVNVYRVYFVMIGIMFCFILSHWEKYNTGILFLPWGYDLSQICMTFLFLVAYFGGHEMWRFKLPFTDRVCAEGFELAMHLGTFLLTVPPTIWNIYVAYRDGTGKNRTLWEATRPLVGTLVLFFLMISWANYSSCGVLQQQPRLFYFLTGTLFSNIACRLIISQMSDTRCELLNWMLYPLSAIVTMVILTQPGNIEVTVLWIFTIFTTVAHIHFGVCVVKEMCEHFKISAFSITKKK